MINKLRKIYCLATALLCFSNIQAQVANDICLTATPFPELSQNIQACVDGSSIGANGELPYINQGYCNGGTTAPNPAVDVWYSFTAVGNRLYVEFASDLTAATLSFYEGDCNALIGRDCIMNEVGGGINYEFSPVDPGTTYYIQVSGNSTTETGDFSLCLTNEEITTNICINNQTIYLDPLPDLGTYSPGETVSICVNVEGYNENASDWLHGFVPVFGDGWDLATLVPYAPGTCDGQGEWDWYESVQGTSNVAIGPQGPGFFYDRNPIDGDPGNNYGDNSGGSSCNWLFCFDITTVTSAPAGTDYLDLSITFLNFSDSETGSWNALNSPCPEDPDLIFKALLQFCDAPTLAVTNPSCANANGGSITATGIGVAPFTFVWSTGFTETGTSSTLDNLSAGFYSVVSTDADGCSQGSSITLVEESTGLNINIPVSVGGCVGCEASAANPVAINILDNTGALFSTQFITACPSLISICLPNDQSFGLQYGNQVIENAVVNGALTDDVFNFVTGTPSNPGDMPNSQQTLCYGDESNALATGVNLQAGHVLAYALHTNSGNSAGTVLAVNANNGSFSVNSAAGIQFNTVYYISSVAGPESSTAGIPDLNNACTQVAPGTPVVFLSPVVLIVNTSCDWQVTGDLTVIVHVSGGLPEYDNTTSYNINGTLLNVIGNNTGVTILNEGQGEHSYTYTATDNLGCNDTKSSTFVCYKTPIELLSFEGKAQTEGNVLTWKTASETDNHYFTITRSIDGTSFEEIGRVLGSGTTLTSQFYTLTDKEAPNGVAYYRLLQTDYNGNTSQVATTLVRRTPATHFHIVGISPVPSNDVANIQFESQLRNQVLLSLYNSAGQLVHQAKYSGEAGLNTIQLDMSAFTTGLYLVRLNNGSDISVQKLVKE